MDYLASFRGVNILFPHNDYDDDNNDDDDNNNDDKANAQNPSIQNTTTLTTQFTHPVTVTLHNIKSYFVSGI